MLPTTTSPSNLPVSLSSSPRGSVQNSGHCSGLHGVRSSSSEVWRGLSSSGGSSQVVASRGGYGSRSNRWWRCVIAIIIAGIDRGCRRIAAITPTSSRYRWKIPSCPIWISLMNAAKRRRTGSVCRHWGRRWWRHGSRQISRKST